MKVKEFLERYSRDELQRLIAEERALKKKEEDEHYGALGKLIEEYPIGRPRFYADNKSYK